MNRANLPKPKQADSSFLLFTNHESIDFP
jgi:hypothetical protein